MLDKYSTPETNDCFYDSGLVKCLYARWQELMGWGRRPKDLSTSFISNSDNEGVFCLL